MEVPHIKCRVVTGPDDIAPFWEWLTHRPKGYVACDTETGAGTPDGNPLDVFAPGFHVRMMQFGDTEGGWAIPMDGWPALVKGSFDWIEKSRTTHVWHNGFTYDYLGLLVGHGIKLDPTTLQDTQVWSRLAGYAEDSMTLKDVAEQRFGGWAGAGSRMLKEGMKNAGWNWTTVPFGWQPYPVYGVTDTSITAMVFEDMEPERKEFRAQHDLEIATAMYTNQMSINGMRVDGRYMKATIGKYLAREAELLTQCKEMGWGKPSQDAEVRRILFEAGVLDDERTTAGGLISIDKKQLLNVDHPLAALVLEYRKVKRTAHDYLDKIWRQAGYTEDSAIIHPSLWSMEARTHRMSASNPPVQQFPANDPTVRNAFIARNPDEELGSADFGQIEMRGWAGLNKDRALLATLNEADRTGEDFFVLMARQLFNELDFQKSDKRRGPIKNTSYATIYAGGEDRIAETAGLPLKQVQPIIAGLRKLYPSFADTGRSMIESFGSGGEAMVHTPSGRRFQVHSWGEQRKLPNYMVQGWAAETLKEALVRCGAAGLGQYMMLAVHDELIFSLPKKEIKDAMAEVKVIMDGVVDPAMLGVPVRAEPVIGSRWGALKD